MKFHLFLMPFHEQFFTFPPFADEAKKRERSVNKKQKSNVLFTSHGYVNNS